MFAALTVELEQDFCHASSASARLAPTPDELWEVYCLKHGDPRTFGRGLRMQRRFDYYTPEEYYEAVVAKLVNQNSSWIDVGSGRNIFLNTALAKRLAERCKLLVGLDPDPNLDSNLFVHKRVNCTIEEFRNDMQFDLVTLRMVAEHLTHPLEALEVLARITQMGGKVVVYTVNCWTPAALCAWMLPLHGRHAFKYLLWRTEERDTFPVAYRMNTRRALLRLFEAVGFKEVYFAYLDDCRVFARFRPMQLLELSLWRLLNRAGLHYPENCLLGVYERSEFP